jgi:hypothetical protein
VALALLIGQAIVSDADAKVRVKATLQTSNARVRISNTSSSYHRIYKKRHLPVRVNIHHQINQRDREIARRLAWYTGVPRRELVQLRRQGYRWFEIGRWLYLPRPVVRAAMHQRSWNRFLREERRLARCDHDPYRGRIMVDADNGYYDD